MIYQILDGQTVINTISADLAFMQAQYPEGNYVEVAPTPEPAAPPAPRHISVGAFFDRFGAAKYPILASTDAGVKALITDCSVRKYIDLDNPALPYGLAMLVSAGYAIDADAVVNAEIAPGEQA